MKALEDDFCKLVGFLRGDVPLELSVHDTMQLYLVLQVGLRPLREVSGGPIGMFPYRPRAREDLQENNPKTVNICFQG